MKKAYTKPEVEKISIDNDVALVMGSPSPPDPGGEPGEEDKPWG